MNNSSDRQTLASQGKEPSTVPVAEPNEQRLVSVNTDMQFQKHFIQIFATDVFLFCFVLVCRTRLNTNNLFPFCPCLVEINLNKKI